jgi:hypothetical protein
MRWLYDLMDKDILSFILSQGKSQGGLLESEQFEGRLGILHYGVNSKK